MVLITTLLVISITIGVFLVYQTQLKLHNERSIRMIEYERHTKLLTALVRKDPIIVDPVPTIDKLGEIIAKLSGNVGVSNDEELVSGDQEEVYRPSFENDEWLNKWNLEQVRTGEGIPTLENSVGPSQITEENITKQ